ncbi:MAG: deoxyguanosinetriphosphate triphosphohydrolase [Actinobacteria bacterium]|nr:deoxyguanosinetriphosphate triphosphohydrolase [Actinomycetota bacterium]
MTTIRERIEEVERTVLSQDATLSATSKGREEAEPPHSYRTAFQRDRDRILHSKAFRRLGHKTQVFLAPEHDHYRVRLTHTLEVTQVARSIARALRLNEDLVEAICLGHDLGHTPFGHLGEEVISDFLHRPFKHNEQSLRIVEQLEKRGDKRGLNLTWEVRDGILNHTWSMALPGTLEGQVARYADRIAYINHDIDDALRAGVLHEQDLPAETMSILGTSSSQRIDTMVTSLLDASASSAQIGMGAEVFDVLIETREFLFERVYNRPEVREEQDRVRKLLTALLDYYHRNPEELPRDIREVEGENDEETLMVDYIAGMTDRFAVREHLRLTKAGAIT